MGKLLERFGDGSASVRHATDGVARAVMANLSSQGDTMHTLLPKTASTAALFYFVLSLDAEAWKFMMMGSPTWCMSRCEAGDAQPAGRSGEQGVAQ